MAIEAPYRSKDHAPAPADKAVPDAADKLTDAEETVHASIEADKRVSAPQVEEEDTQDIETEEEVAEGESTEVPDDPDQEELRRGYLRHADYTKKRMADAERIKELETRYSGYETLDRFISENPQLAATHTLEQIAEMIRSPERVNAQTQPSLSTEDRRAINTVRAEIQQERESLFFDRVEEVIKSTSKRYAMTKAEEQAFAKRAVDEEFVAVGMSREKMRGKLDILAKAMTYKDAERKGQSKLIGKLKEKQRAASVPSTSSAPVQRTERPKGWAKLIDKHTRGA